MSSSQVPIWVPLVVAALGVTGVVAGQLVSSWREDQRWKREMKREDLRWNREQTKEQLKEKFELAAYWRKERLTAYAEFLDVMHDWRNCLTDILLIDNPSEEHIRSRIADMDKLYDASFPAIGRIFLVGSKDISDSCHELSSYYASTYHRIKANDAEGDISRLADRLSDSFFELVDELRSDLGVDSPPHRDSSS